MTNFIPDLYEEAILADIILTDTEGTYVGKYDRALFDPDAGDVHEQPIWRIRFFENSEIGTSDSGTGTIPPTDDNLDDLVNGVQYDTEPGTDEDSDSDDNGEDSETSRDESVSQAIYPTTGRVIRILYPDGRKNFMFVWNNLKTYNYKYAL